MTQALLELVGEPLLSCTLQWPDEEQPLNDLDDDRARLERSVDLVLDAGNCGTEPTTVLDLTGDAPVLLRQGQGRCLDARAGGRLSRRLAGGRPV